MGAKKRGRRSKASIKRRSDARRQKTCKEMLGADDIISTASETGAQQSGSDTSSSLEDHSDDASVRTDSPFHISSDMEPETPPKKRRLHSDYSALRQSIRRDLRKDPLGLAFDKWVSYKNKISYLEKTSFLLSKYVPE